MHRLLILTALVSFYSFLIPANGSSEKKISELVLERVYSISHDSQLHPDSLERLLGLAQSNSQIPALLGEISFIFSELHQQVATNQSQVSFTENRDRWTEYFRAEFSRTLDSSRPMDGLERFVRRAQFIEKASAMYVNADYLPRNFKVTQQGFNVRILTAQEMENILGEYISENQFDEQISSALLTNGLVKISNILHGEKYGEAFHDIDKIKLFIQHMPSEEIVKHLHNLNLSDAHGYALPAFERIKKGLGSIEDISYVEQFSALSHLSVNQALGEFLGTEAQLESTIKNYFDLIAQGESGTFSPERNPNITDAVFENLGKWWNIDQQIQFITVYGSNLSLGASKGLQHFFGSQKEQILKILEEAILPKEGKKPKMTAESLEAFLARIPYSGRKEDDDILDVVAKSQLIDSSLSTYVENHVKSKMKTLRWKLALRLKGEQRAKYLEGKGIFFCNFILQKFLSHP